jgi:hypothetical protein
MPNLDFEVFDGKSFKDLCKDVVERSQSKKDQLDTLISDIRSLIKQPNDVQVFMPRIKELLEVGIKNDEQIVKLCAVVQRLQSTQIEASGGDTVGLSDEEKVQLIQARENEIKTLKEIKEEVESSIS